ncbi:uncharacterized protein LOC126428312 isoform X2 [Schistocerca serialis cubense]|uniref:uncharacterized protein LOC126428312 isoform X2 n=1 Tax=Schistocerca serialis cubense TaxID=2023355 RepID=UPI00214F3C03|nr:uncharacterized protein LOC126428312 isoform X2 [Schistocerca serialis cubense]
MLLETSNKLQCRRCVFSLTPSCLFALDVQFRFLQGFRQSGHGVMCGDLWTARRLCALCSFFFFSRANCVVLLAIISDRRPPDNSSPSTSNSLWFEGTLDSTMASKSEYSGRCHVAGEDVKLCRAGIDDLPDEILVTIFSHVSFSDLLDVVQKVCHRWRRLSQEMELWADKDYHIGIPSHCNSKNCKGSVTELEAIQIFQNAPNLCKACIWHDVSPRLFRTLSEKCRRLKELRLRSTQKPSYSMLKNLVERCSSLQMMRISDNLLRSEEFSEAVSRLRNLRVLRLDHDCTEGTSASQPCVLLRPLADGCPQLAEMDFGRSFANIDELRYFLNAKSNTLKSIRIKWTMGGTRSISPLLTVCANSLERVQLYETHLDHTAVTEAFTALGSLKNLQELMITLPDQLLPGTAALAFKNGGLPKLRVLHLHNGCKLDDDAVIAISHGCPALRELSIKYAENLSDTAFSQIYHLQHLEILSRRRRYWMPLDSSSRVNVPFKPMRQPPLPPPQHAVAPPFRSFDPNEETWTEWSRQFGFHLAAYRIQGNERQPFLLSCVGVSTYRVIVKLSPRRDVATLSYEEILSALDAYFKETVNVVAKRYTFFRTKRTAGQTNREWVATLQGLTRECDFECECGLPYSDTMARDAIAQNVSDVRIREQILKLVNPSLQQVIDILDRQDNLTVLRNLLKLRQPCVTLTGLPGALRGPVNCPRAHQRSCRHALNQVCRASTQMQ